MHLPIVLVVGMVLLGTVSSQQPGSWGTLYFEPPDNCTRSCGSMSIPFPFGISGEYGCYHDYRFVVRCSNEIGQPKLFLVEDDIEVTSISSTRSEVEVMALAAYDCGNNNSTTRRQSTFSYSDKNRFVAVGCEAEGYVTGGRGTVGGCVSTCDTRTSNGSCSGFGCCETAIPKWVGMWSIRVLSSNVSGVTDQCIFAFVVEEGKYKFSSLDFVDFGGKSMMMPQILYWDVGNHTCNNTVNKEAGNFLCKGKSECIQEYSGPGYQCRCLAGYQGNPYIKNGCININECDQEDTHDCKDKCIDTPGSYTCPCPNDQDGNNTKNNNTCTAKKLPIIEISVGTSVGGLFLIVLFTWICVGLRRHKKLMLREKYFKQNGGIMLKQRISGDGGSYIQTKVFTVEELEKATNNYHESTIIGKGGYGTVYRGVLPDDTLVAIKKSKIADPDETQVEQFINEVIIVSQINHRNVVKLIGCCLETQVPSLVYEFIPNGTLFDHIHDECKSKLISWAIRLKLATETAGALSYLHSAASVPIIHRDVKPMNILIDDNYVAKVADFGASKLNPTDQNELETMVQGTRGYLDPEYLQTGQLTEKSDVYSFGAVLVEILTGKKIVDFNKPENERHVTRYFITCLKEDTLLQVLDEKLQLKEVPHEIIQVSRLAQRCLHLKGDERPTMKEVALELEGISASKIENHPWVKSTSNEEQTECLLNGPSEDCEDTNASAFFSIIAKPKV